MKESLRYSLLYLARIAVYAALMFALNAVFMYDAQHPTVTGKFGEVSGTEILQELFLFLLGIIFIFVARLDRSIAAIANLISVFFFMAFIREFNNQIDYWFYLVLPLMLLFAWLAFRDRKKLVDGFYNLLQIPSVAYLFIGFLVTFIFSRLFGRTKFWEALLEESYTRPAKNAAEEGIELLGYSLFFIAGIEILFYVLRKRKEEKRR